jgi:uncharacterized protein (DUF58 family)
MLLSYIFSTLIYLIITNNYSELFKVDMFLLALVLFLYIYVDLERNLSLKHLHIQRVVEVLKDEEESEIIIYIKNTSYYPFFLRLEDSPPRRFLLIERPKWFLILGGGSELKLKYKVIPAPGLSAFGPLKLIL